MKYRLVDIDSLVFKSAVRGLETVEVQKGLYIEAFNLESGMKELTDILSPLETLNTKLVVFGKSLNVERYNFRNIINPQYKADRKEARTPVGLGLLYDKFYRCNKVIQCEAYEETDDCIVRHYNKAKDSNFSVEIVSIDKDFIAVGDLVHPLTLEVREHDPLFWYKQCFDDNTEVLTENGFKLFRDVNEAEKVAQFDTTYGSISFAIPLDRIAQPSVSGKIAKLNTSLVDIAVTPDHDVLVKTHKNKCYKKVKPRDISLRWHKVPSSGVYLGDSDNKKEYSEVMARLAVAAAADSFIISKKKNLTKNIGFAFKKERKIERLKDLLGQVNIPYREREYIDPTKGRYVIFTIELPTPFKKLDSELLHAPLNIRLALIDELKHWDGRKVEWNEGFEYYTSKKHEADLVSSICAISGYSCTIRKYAPRENSITYENGTTSTIRGGESYRLLIHPRGELCLGKQKFKEEEYTGMTYCFTMPKGTLVVRRNGCTHISGNCILGDGADNIKGIKGMGQVACNKLFEGIKTKEEAEAVLLETYAKKKLDVMDLYKDYFCLALDHKASESCLYNTAFGVTSKVDLLNQTWEILTDERVQCKQYQNINR